MTRSPLLWLLAAALFSACHSAPAEGAGDSGMPDDALMGRTFDGGFAPDTHAPDAGSAPDVGSWPLPIPGSPGTGPVCPAPPHAPIGEDWPEVFVGQDSCDDAGEGTRLMPFCTFERAFEVADAAPYVVTIMEGTYRQGGHSLSRPGTADEYFVVRADEGASPVILGSAALDGASFAQAGELVRIDVSSLGRDPKGFWTSEGIRIAHVMESRDGARSHAPTSDLSEPGTWTKADETGAGCGDENEGCFIYMRPPVGMNVPATRFEASQSSFFHTVGGNYQVVDGLTVLFTQSTAIFTEESRYLLIQNSSFGHAANGDDNSYNLRLWGADGSIVRRNRVWDSRYWGGAVNSHGITFMVAGDDADIWVCENEVFDTIGMGVSTKNGSSNIHVVANYFHDLGTGVHTSNYRCDWRGCDERLFPGGGYVVRENLFESCDRGVAIARNDAIGVDERVAPSRIFNNVFVDVERAVETLRFSSQPVVRNNITVGSGHGLYFVAGGETTWPDFYIGQGFDSDFNVFSTSDAPVYVYANWSGTEEALSLGDYQSRYEGDANSLAGDPELDEHFAPSHDSSVVGTGDPSVYEDADTVNRGLFPFLTP